METTLTKMLGIKYPIIMAPMFLVSNTNMIIAALESGITGAFPALNYRTDVEFRNAIDEIRSKTDKPFGVNLIVNKSNIKFETQLKTCVDKKVDFIITSLGSPEKTILECKPKGIRVFCDVVDEKYALKVEKLGADAIIAVNKEAGGHAGDIGYKELIPLLSKRCSIPIISAGGVATAEQLDEILKLGAAGVSMGTVFIATVESEVSEDYKNALIEYKAEDIVRTSNLSGTPLTVINTPYLQEIGTEPSWLQKNLMKRKWLKKYVKMFIVLKGMKSIEKSTFGASYKTIWVAGPTIEDIHEVKPIKTIVENLTSNL